METEDGLVFQTVFSLKSAAKTLGTHREVVSGNEKTDYVTI